MIGRYARTTLVWKAQARALIKVRILAGACLACRPDARLTAPRAPEQDSGEPRGWCAAAARDAKKRKQQEFAKELRAHKQLVAQLPPKVRMPCSSAGAGGGGAGGVLVPTRVRAHARRQVWRFDPRVRMLIGRRRRCREPLSRVWVPLGRVQGLEVRRKVDVAVCIDRWVFP